MINTGETLLTKPQITQSQEIISTPRVQTKIISQPIVTKRIVSQPIIKQRIVKTPIVRQTKVTRPVYTESEVKEPIVDSKSEFRTVPVMIPGRQIMIEKVVQPVQRVVEEKINV